ncbi:tRNA(Met) cytidine acetyltransferase TmcA [Marinobacter sp.]|uniref:tRNA(Met) cytidine acetyltransferase TmcA n=1 Tax=Marinobacter sp. TaxID=50741 RepID=UPI0034A5A186
MAAEPLDSSSDVARWQAFQAELAARGERRLVVLEGERGSAIDWLRQRLPALTWQRGVWTGTPGASPDERLVGVPARQARQWLGRELDLLVWDGWQGNPPDSLAALAGTLKAGGLWFWLMPPLDQWRGFADPDYARTGISDANDHPFAARMAAILAESPDVIRVNPERGGAAVLPPLNRPSSPFEVTGTEDQQRAIDEIVRTGQGRRRRPLVITADRGRGKSAALGMAAVRLLNQGRHHVVVTAPGSETVETLFHHARLAAGESACLDEAGTTLALADGSRLSFLATDQLLEQAPEAELVMVDEAAAIPAQRLTRILTGWPRVVFATTVHGYEGTGRGFAIRFRDLLDTRTPQWRQIALKAPVRWSATDPLEPLVSRLFLLNADVSGDRGRDATLDITPDVTLEAWSPARASENELAEAFGLLVNAHYRTTPSDLRQWLDDPAAVSWRIRVNGRLAGVLWAVREGGFTPALADQVMRGQRRVRGHLLAQSLANHSGFPGAASCTWLRVVRVAVNEPYRSRGLGTQLVEGAVAYAGRHGCDGVGTSFGGSEPLFRFWQRAGLSLARPGMTREASTGEYPLQMLRATTNAGHDLLLRLRQRLAEHWLTLVPLYWRSLEPELTWLLTAELSEGQVPGADDRRDLASFANGHRGFELMVPVLRSLSLGRGACQVLARSDDNGLWMRSVIQGWSWPELQHAGWCEGRKDGERRLRRLAGRILENSDNL